jgi:hypothetical protein
MELGNYFDYQEQKDILNCCILSDLIYQKDKYIEKIYNFTHSKVHKTDKILLLKKCCGASKDYLLTIKDLIKQPLLYRDNFLIKDRDVDIHYGTFIFKDKLIIVYQGTYDMNEVIADLDIKQVKMNDYYPNILIHEGFKNAFLSSKDTVIKNAYDYSKIYPNNKIYITGHSLGASVATLAAVYLKDKYEMNNLYCVSFGCPKIGNKEFTEYVDKHLKNNIQFINNEDIVPTLPPLPNYKLLKPIYIIKDGKIMKDNKNKRYKDMFFDFVFSIFNYNKCPIEMHHSGNYLKDLKEAYLDLFITLNEEDEE